MQSPANDPSNSVPDNAAADLNYFNYFTEIEEAFVRRRGKHLWLSPVDWALMEAWKDNGIPLHVALRGIEKSFDSFEAKPRYRTVKSLLYCREEVEAQYSEWLAARVGAADSKAETESTKTDLPFPRETICLHLDRARDAISERIQMLTGERDLDLAEAYARAAERLVALRDDVTGSENPGGQRLEESLTHLERMLDEAIRRHAPEEKLVEVRAFAEGQLAEFRKRMDKETYAQTCESVFVKRLREDYGLPRLSLFYL